MGTTVFDKTDKGREEIATRKYHIPARMRALLLLIDGKRTREQLLGNVAGLGLDHNSIEELLSLELIFSVPGTEPVIVAKPVFEAAGSARARAMARQAARVAAPSPASSSVPVPVTAYHAEAAPPDVGAIDVVTTLNGGVSQATVAQTGELHAFYNRSIKANLGLRGMMLQLKVEKADGIEQLRDLRLPFLEAVLKAKGSEVALALRDELDALLGGAPRNDQVAMSMPGETGYGAFAIAAG